MIFNVKIKSALALLVIIFFYSIPLSLISQKVLDEGENKLVSKDIDYDRKIIGQKFKIKITPIINYVINPDADFKESIVFNFNVDWLDPKNNETKYPENERVFIIGDSEEFEKKCNESKSIGFKKGIKDSDSKRVLETIEFTPKKIVKYIPIKYLETIFDISEKVAVDIKNYENEVITLKALFYLGTKSNSGDIFVSVKVNELEWEFQLPEDRPVCQEKEAFYNKRFELVEPKQQLQSLEDKLYKGKDLYNLYDSVFKYDEAIKDLENLKDKIDNDNDKFNCTNLNPIVRQIGKYLDQKDRVRKLLVDIEQQMDSDSKNRKTLSINLKLLDENVSSAQRLYRDLWKLKWDSKETQKPDSDLVARKMTSFNNLNEKQDSLYAWIVENSGDDPENKLKYQDFISFYNASNDIISNLVSDNDEIVAVASDAPTSEKQIKKERTKKGIPFFFYLIPILSFVLGVVAFKYMGKIKKVIKIKKKVKS